MMTLNKDGNYLPWVQPAYGHDAQDKRVSPPKGFKIVRFNTRIRKGWMVFDVYAGWMKPDDHHARNGYYTGSSGRWTTWAKPIKL